MGRESDAGAEQVAPAPVSQTVPPEVIDFIRYCYQRRRIGWPELYDEMCGVAARGEFRGMDYDRLAALAQRVVIDERRRRVAIPVERSPVAVISPATDEVRSPGLQAMPQPR